MKVYPVIYGRTNKLDYISDFLLRPEDFDSKTAIKYVSKSLNDVKYCGGIRHAIFKVENYVIYGGIACVSERFARRIVADYEISEVPRHYMKFLSDSSGREISFFIGFAIPKCEIKVNMIPRVDLKYAYEIYLSQLEKCWDAITLETQISEAIEVECDEYVGDFKPRYFDYKNCRILENYSEEKYREIMNYFFVEMCKNEDCSFLSTSLYEEVKSGSQFMVTSLYDCSIMKLKSYEDASLKQPAAKYETLSDSARKVSDIGDCENDNKKIPRIKTVEDLKKKSVPTKQQGKPILLVCIIVVLIVVLIGLILIW